MLYTKSGCIIDYVVRVSFTYNVTHIDLNTHWYGTRYVLKYFNKAI